MLYRSKLGGGGGGGQGPRLGVSLGYRLGVKLGLWLGLRQGVGVRAKRQFSGVILGVGYGRFSYGLGFHQ